MNMRWFLLFVSLVSAGTFAKIDPLQWNVIEERGGREYTIHNHNGDKISFYVIWDSCMVHQIVQVV